MSELADRGKPERAAYHLKKKNTPSACTQQLPALWCAIQNEWAGAEVLVRTLPHLRYWELDEALWVNWMNGAYWPMQSFV